jgi:predicted CXXCH cytochrome family protein
MHGPVELGACLICHDPHASDTLAQVRGAVNVSCLRCHEEIRFGNHVVRGVSGREHPLEGLRNPADGTKPFNCASCHNPHAGNTKAYLRGEGTGMVFCLYCHKK